MKKSIFIVIAILGMVGLFLVGQSVVNATAIDCGEYVYEKTSDYSDSRVVINFSNNDLQISVNGMNGYAVTEYWLDVESDGFSGYHLYGTSNVTNFNPTGGTINEAKVKVFKACSTPVPSASPSATPVVTPTASPSATPVPSSTPVPSCEELQNCETPQPSESPRPTEPPVKVETPLTVSGVGECPDTAPTKIPVIFVANAGVGALEVRWTPSGGDKAHILYGFEAGKPQHSLLDTPNDGVEPIRDLVSGKHYYFAVTNGSGCAWSSLSDWYDPIVE